jgi:hypothetical protein
MANLEPCSTEAGDGLMNYGRNVLYVDAWSLELAPNNLKAIRIRGERIMLWV